ncbi:threonine-phosphate decarboxylase CobD [Rhodopseudomonas sp. HC1]|uniref:threonine-phosphate decarboxylase CobD n=1 Tax=Rhodopseudomonas infernalis TaxID=2897386 RepID=UPI001EE87FEA|nr:threonine-phosphate decarboxylase CobD [Rhodopseudomonas infernalis]MCG6205213.1 threonine-phosphate decarboxylase CobD [Rhodopseudomonas infernalis]
MTGSAAAALRIHGGRVDLAAQAYPDAPLPWIDLSTGINPIAYPVPPLPPEAFARLPLATELHELCAAAADAYGLPQGAAMLPAPGSEIAIRLTPRVLAARPAAQVGILTPTYSSHAAAWRAAGARVHELGALPDPDAALDALVVVNPNNPDGRGIDAGTLAAFAATWCASGKRLVVDEAFAEVRPELSLLRGAALPPGLVVLRSLGKFFGLAGLRLGFVAVNAGDAPPWRDLLGDWAASGPACAIGTRAMRDTAWIASARERLAADRRRLDATLTAAGLTARGGTDLFGLYEDNDGRDLVDAFARAGILIRGFTHSPQCYRFGLPGDAAAWQRLEQVCATLQGRKAANVAAG